MARPKYHSHLCFFLLHLFTCAISFSVVSASDSAICSMPSPAPVHLGAGEDMEELLRFFRLSSGYFFGGDDIHFPKDESDGPYLASRSFTLLPLQLDRTTDAGVFHVAATLTLTGGPGGHSVSFYLHGYYNSSSGELCMAGTGTYSVEGGSLKYLRDVIAGFRFPSPPTISDPFVTGRLKGAGFEAISLVAYAEGDDYAYGESASCPPPPQPPSAARRALQALGADFSCAHLKDHLVSSYKLQYGGAHSPAILPRRELRMHVGRVECSEGGKVRAYAAFSNDTNMWLAGLVQPGFMIREEAVVAEGRWDPERSMLCLRACRVARSGPTSLAVQEQGCDIGMSFWFPNVWTIRDRSVVSGTVWDSSPGSGAGGDSSAGVVSVSSIGSNKHIGSFFFSRTRRANFSDVRYNYTMIEKAESHYLAAMPNNGDCKNGNRAANYTYHDFDFGFYLEKGSGYGEAHPVTIGSAVVYGDRLAADDSFSRRAMAEVKARGGLLSVSYDIRVSEIRPGVDLTMLPTKNMTDAIQERQITAEGVYDPRTGVLCMIGCREHSGSTDCQILVTVEFASLDAKANGFGKGVISSLRNGTTDPLYFERTDISLFGTYPQAKHESEVISS